MGKPGAAYLPRSGRLNPMIVFRRLFYIDAHQENTMRDHTQPQVCYFAGSTVQARTSYIEESDTECQSVHLTMTHIAPSAEADDYAADFNICDPPGAAAAAVAGQDESE